MSQLTWIGLQIVNQISNVIKIWGDPNEKIVWAKVWAKICSL